LIRHRLDFVIEQDFAESVPYPDETFDFAISEYGAALWADPEWATKWPTEEVWVVRKEEPSYTQ
jgi:hypothetical protein